MMSDVELRSAVQKRRYYLEKYTCSFELVNQLVKYLPSEARNLVQAINDSDGETSTDNGRIFDLMLDFKDDEGFKMKWKALERALESPGQELLLYILTEKDESELQVLEGRDNLVRGRYKEALLTHLKGELFCNTFPFTTSQREKIECKFREEGKQAGINMILKYMVKHRDWFKKLVEFLDKTGCSRLAKEIRKRDHELTATDSPAKNTRSSDHSPLPMVDDPDQTARKICAFTQSLRSENSIQSNDSESSSTPMSISSPHLAPDRNKGSTSLTGSLSGSYSTSFSGQDLSASAASVDTGLSEATEMIQRINIECHAQINNNSDYYSSLMEKQSNFYESYPKAEEPIDFECKNSSGEEEYNSGIGFHVISKQRKEDDEKRKAQALQPMPRITNRNSDFPRHSSARNREQHQCVSNSPDTIPNLNEAVEITDREHKCNIPDRFQVYRCERCLKPFYQKKL